ncbi:MAG: hypothetical protein R6U30_14980, partial [Halomonas sp.]|uniref:hypothetical protein n=1 Tax=Halomonas sp. TaxID=1486246 RepID=UPI003970D3F6
RWIGFIPDYRLVASSPLESCCSSSTSIPKDNPPTSCFPHQIGKLSEMIMSMISWRAATPS